MYIADFVRCVAARPVGGLLIEDAEAAPGPADRYAPVLNAARHYRWAVVGRGVRPGQEPLFDAVIGGGDGVQGQDVSLPLFAGSELPESGTMQFRYACIPPDHPPEAVLDALVRMRA